MPIKKEDFQEDVQALKLNIPKIPAIPKKYIKLLISLFLAFIVIIFAISSFLFIKQTLHKPTLSEQLENQRTPQFLLCRSLCENAKQMAVVHSEHTACSQNLEEWIKSSCGENFGTCNIDRDENIDCVFDENTNYIYCEENCTG